MSDKQKEFGPEVPNYAVLNEALRKHKNLSKGVVTKEQTKKGPSQSSDQPKPN